MQNLRVLLIEDDENDAALAKRYLSRGKRCHFELEWKSTLAEGRDRLKEGGIDVVLLDLSLPDSAGLETFDQLRTTYRELAILVLTGHDDEDTAVRSVKLGAEDYLVKGQMNTDNLSRAIRYAIERKRASLQLTSFAEELSRRNDQLQEELKLAQEIQRALLPRQTHLNRANRETQDRPWVLAHRYLPTEWLAGDFFKFYPLSEGRVGALICDVMGHGVRSALVGALLCGLIEEYEEEREFPGLMLTRLNTALNRVLGHTRSEMFVTACYLVLDPPRRRLTISNAGHPAPYLLRRNSNQIMELDQCRGPALGLFEKTQYADGVKQAEENDLVVLYTDGLSEVEGPGGVFFDMRLRDALHRLIDFSGDQVLDSLIDEARQFSVSGKFDDDVCLIALQLGNEAANVPGSSTQEETRLTLVG